MKNCLVTVHKVDDAKISLFLFPFAGGTAQSYRFLYQSGDVKGCNIYALEMPGRGVRMSEPFTMNVDEIRESCISAIKPHLTDKMIFLGHSMGAILAYELLRDVEAIYPEHRSSLLISAANSPRSLKIKNDIFKMTGEEFKEYVIQMGGMPEQIMANDALVEFFLPRIYSDFGLLQQYKPRSDAPLHAPISVIAPTDDDNLEKAYVLDWENYTTSSFSIHWCTGGHFYLYQNAEVLKNELNRIIQELSHE